MVLIMSERNYRIKYRKGDFEVEVQGDKDWVESKFKELTSKEIAIAAEEAPKIEGMPATLVEFLDMKGNPKKHTDATAVFAYWLFTVEKTQSFKVKDILGCYDRTRKIKPRNLNDIMNTNVKRHIFAEAREKKDGLKAWVITLKGEEYVQQMK